MPLVDGWLVVQCGIGYYLSYPPPYLLFPNPNCTLLYKLLIETLQQQNQKTFNQTFNQLLLQDFKPLPIEPEACESQLFTDSRGQACSKNFDAPNSRKYSDNNFPPFLTLDGLSMVNQRRGDVQGTMEFAWPRCLESHVLMGKLLQPMAFSKFKHVV